MTYHTTVYIAAPFAEKLLAEVQRKVLFDKGYDVVSRWHDLSIEHLYDNLEAEASRDLVDINRAQALLWNGLGETIGSGRHFEAGVAYTARKPVIHIGEVGTTMFAHSPGIFLAQDINEAIQILDAIFP